MHFIRFLIYRTTKGLIPRLYNVFLKKQNISTCKKLNKLCQNRGSSLFSKITKQCSVITLRRPVVINNTDSQVFLSH